MLVCHIRDETSSTVVTCMQVSLQLQVLMCHFANKTFDYCNYSSMGCGYVVNVFTMTIPFNKLLFSTWGCINVTLFRHRDYYLARSSLRWNIVGIHAMIQVRSQPFNTHIALFHHPNSLAPTLCSICFLGSQRVFSYCHVVLIYIYVLHQFHEGILGISKKPPRAFQ